MDTNDKYEIQLEVRTIEVPVSEYRDLISGKAKLDAVIRFACSHDKYDTNSFFKNLFASEIMQAMTELNLKEDPDE